MVEYAALVYVFGGIALLSATLIPRYFECQPLSMPIVYVATGLVLFSIVLYGPVTPPVMRTLDRLRERDKLEEADEALRDEVPEPDV